MNQMLNDSNRRNQVVREIDGWHDLAETAAWEFLLDYDDGEEVQSEKVVALRWPDNFRDEVLARLLELNEQRHKEELLLAKSLNKPEKETKQPKNRKAETDSVKKTAKEQQKGLF